MYLSTICTYYTCLTMCTYYTGLTMCTYRECYYKGTVPYICKAIFRKVTKIRNSTCDHDVGMLLFRAFGSSSFACDCQKSILKIFSHETRIW